MGVQYGDYKVLSKPDARELEKEVKDALGKGWTLHGGLVIWTVPQPLIGNAQGFTQQVGKTFYCQAVIK